MNGLGRLNAVRDSRGKNPGGLKGALFNGTRYERAGAPLESSFLSRILGVGGMK